MQQKESIIKKRRELEREYLDRFELILFRKNDVAVYKVFLEYGASFSREIKKICKLPENSTHKAIGNLIDAGLIDPLHKIKQAKKIGPKATLYAHLDVTDEEIQQAESRYMKSHVKHYRSVEQLYQRTLYEVKDEEIQYSKIFNIVRSNNRSRTSYFPIQSITDEIAYRLHHERKVKVWR